MNTRFATSPDSTRIAFDVSGAGVPLLLLHGGGGSRLDWRKTGYVARLQDTFTVVAMDLRGHGESGKPASPASYSTEKMGQDILAVADAVADHCGFERFILCGYSFGGNVSRYLAARSERVSRLIMIGNRLGAGVSGGFRQFVFDFRERWKPVVEIAGAEFDPRSLPEKDQEELQQLSFPAGLLPAVLAWSSAMLDWGVVTPADLRCPTLWLIGAENENAMESFEEYAGELPCSAIQAHIFPGMNHEQEFDDIEAVLPVILEFIEARPSMR